jgi:hypothetical protein
VCTFSVEGPPLTAVSVAVLWCFAGLTHTGSQSQKRVSAKAKRRAPQSSESAEDMHEPQWKQGHLDIEIEIELKSFKRVNETERERERGRPTLVHFAVDLPQSAMTSDGSTRAQRRAGRHRQST